GANGRLDNTYRYYCVCQNERQTIGLRTNGFCQNAPSLSSSFSLVRTALPAPGHFGQFASFRRRECRLADVSRKSVADRNRRVHSGKPALPPLDLQNREIGKIVSSHCGWQRLCRI